MTNSPDLPHDGQTIDVGQVHTLDADGCCRLDCPHADHIDAPLLVALHPALEGMFSSWLEQLDLRLQHMPAPPGEHEGMHSYVVVITPGSPAAQLLKPPAIADHMAKPPQTWHRPPRRR